jgi:hypothetical protein
MSKSFIEEKHNSNSLDVAVRQYNQLSYFLQSEVQKNFTEDYFEKYIERKYYNDDFLLNFVKSVFKSDNFLSFAKYYRNPNPSSQLINTRIKEPLSRVFFAEDSYFNYVINGKYESFPKELDDDFEERLFDAVLFRYNDIIIHDLFEENRPYREFVSIKNVVSIKMERREIKKIAYTAKVEIDGEYVYGYAYIDDEKYEFYNKEYDLLKTTPHDLGFCPATFVVKKEFKNDCVVKESPFSYLRSDFEEYCFLKTLQRMVDANGTVPIMVKTKTNEVSTDSSDFDDRNGEPMSIEQIGGQVSKEARATAGNGKGAVLQAGTVVETPAIEKNDGSIDTEFNKNFIVFHYTPTEALSFLNKRIKTVEETIITSSIGNYSDNGTVQGSKSDTEIKSNDIVFKEDKLRFLSNTLSASRGLSDKVMLALAYGKENIKVDVFYGSDFFLETQDKLYEMFQKSPNAIERKNILIRLSQRRNMYNKEKAKREVLLYKLMPYTSDKDFELAVSNQRVSDINFEYQTRFSYWIAMFESMVGNIVMFYESLGDLKESERIITINNLITSLINNNIKTNQNGKETSNS